MLGSFTKESPWMKLNKIGEVWNSANGLLSDVFGFLSSKNFATIPAWRNDFSLLVLPIDNKTNKQKEPFWSAPDEKNQAWTGFKPITSGSVLLFATRTSPIMHLIWPPKFCISIVFNFSWDGCYIQEKWKTKVMQIFFGGGGANNVH